MKTPIRLLLLVVIVTLSTSMVAAQSSSTTVFSDDFATAPGTSGKWFYFQAGPFVGNDGVESASTADGLRVVSSGINPTTGKPAFTSTMAQEGSVANPYGLPGGFDHVKWLMYTNNISSNGVPGYDAIAGQEVVGGALISGELFGTAGHPFGRNVTNATGDPRLAAVALNAVDLESWMVFDFFITNDTVYALYERLPFGRETLGNYASFTFMIPLERRSTDDWHDLRIAYDREAGVVRWIVDGAEEFRVDRIGYRLDRKYTVLDHGGVEGLVSPRQLNFGMGSFTLLDAQIPGSKALVKLSTAPDFYFSTSKGEPTQQTFVDKASKDGSRLFGQGAELRVKHFTVETRASTVTDD